MKRRSFLKLVASLPFVGGLLPKEPEIPLPPAVMAAGSTIVAFRGYVDYGYAATFIPKGTPLYWDPVRGLTIADRPITWETVERVNHT